MDFKYEIKIMADPEEVFSALTNPFQIGLWSGYPADMKAEVGYVFSLWEGDITGVNLEIVPDRLLVQEWFFGENEEPSIVRLELKKERNPGTIVQLLHTHIPEEVFEEITEGWKVYYLGSVKNMLEMY
ncbi:SRPBCC domain-containing protein [uncultured Odoribacter sp.]|uniref:SRPBCC domain-containing protein n=1 Tax=uncultured Odoribacter sp. TaxID=876416 RepID=UPI00261551A2|nr:SRPBCC domain-containing protein [uncultured Odoribacter sp.]